MRVSATITVNGHPVTVAAPPMERLLDVLRRHLALTGTKEGCGEGECGACSVLLNGELVNSCLVPIAQCEDAEITTIEGIHHPVQQAFLEHGAAQCGICTPGMVLAAVSLLGQHSHPTQSRIREALAGNLCRCTGYMRIFEAIESCARTSHNTSC